MKIVLTLLALVGGLSVVGLVIVLARPAVRPPPVSQAEPAAEVVEAANPPAIAQPPVDPLLLLRRLHRVDDPQFHVLTKACEGRVIEVVRSLQAATDPQEWTILEAALHRLAGPTDVPELLRFTESLPVVAELRPVQEHFQSIRASLAKMAMGQVTWTMAEPLVNQVLAVRAPGDVELIQRVGACFPDGFQQRKLWEVAVRRGGMESGVLLRAWWRCRPAKDFADHQQGLMLAAAEAGIEDAFLRLPQIAESPWVTWPGKMAVLRYLRRQPALATALPVRPWAVAHAGRLVFQQGVWSLADDDHPPRYLPDPEAPAPLALPKDLSSSATLADIRAWLERQCTAISVEKGLTATDPRIIAMAGLPKTAIPELVAQANAPSSKSTVKYFALRALRLMVGPEDQGLILAQLPQNPGFYRLVVERGWVSLALDQARKDLKDPTRIRSSDDIRAAARVLLMAGTPADHLFIVDLIRRQRYGYHQRDLADDLRRTPGAPWQDVVRTMWRQGAPRAARSHGEALAVLAYDVGEEDALPVVVRMATGESQVWATEEIRHDAQAVLRKRFALQDETPETIATWWEGVTATGSGPGGPAKPSPF